MIRYTIRNDNGSVELKKGYLPIHALYRLAEYEDRGQVPLEIPDARTKVNILAALGELAEYKDAERDGRLVVLPRKVGKQVYWFTGTVIIPCTVYGYVIDNKGKLRMELPDIDCTPIYPWPGHIFLTRTEAEKALKGAAET